MGDLATDSFTRTVASGLSTADLGGSWSTSLVGSPTPTAAVDGTRAVLTAASNSSATANLPAALGLATDVLVACGTTETPTGLGTYLGPTARAVGTNYYRARVRIQSSGVMTLQLVRAAGVIDNLIGSAATVPGTYVAPGKLWVRIQVLNSNPTTIRARAWLDGTAEPSSWQVTTTDNTAGYQAPGGVGIWGYASSSSSTSGVYYDQLDANRLYAPAAGWGRRAA